MLEQVPRSHPEDEILELFCLGRLDEEKLAATEEHLLLCARCQDRVQELDLFLKAARHAAQEVRQEDKYQPSTPKFQWFAKPVWLTAAAVAAALVIAVSLTRTAATPENVELSTLRGDAATGIGVAKAGHPLNLKIDLRGVSMANCCLIEVVNSAGAILSYGEVAAANDTAQFSAPQLDAGRYWVRVKSKTGEALRETGLDVR